MTYFLLLKGSKVVKVGGGGGEGKPVFDLKHFIRYFISTC